jgi:hypothetical protein
VPFFYARNTKASAEVQRALGSNLNSTEIGENLRLRFTFAFWGFDGRHVRHDAHMFELWHGIRRQLLPFMRTKAWAADANDERDRRRFDA